MKVYPQDSITEVEVEVEVLLSKTCSKLHNSHTEIQTDNMTLDKRYQKIA